MSNVMWVGIGGAAGSLARYWVWTVVAPRSSGFPWATYAVNVSGSFLLGLLAGVLVGRIDPAVRFGLMFGVLGGYTTFSTFTVDTIELIRVGEWVPAISNVVLSVATGLGAALAGIMLGEAIRPAG